MSLKFEQVCMVECDNCGARFITSIDRSISCPTCGHEGYCEGETDE